MHFPEPVMSVAIEPKTKADQDKLTMALIKLSEEDPTFPVRTDDETAQTIIKEAAPKVLELDCCFRDAAKNAIVTDRKRIPNSLKKELDVLFGEYL